MNKKLTVAIAAAALSVSMAVPAMARWNQLGTNSWQWVENGSAVKDKWVTTQNGQYYINLEGLASVNWINWNGNWYFGEQGANLGNVLKNTWATIDGNVYYFDANGVMATGTQNIGGTTYTFGTNGHCTTTPTGVTMRTISTTSTSTVSSNRVSSGNGGTSGGGGVTPSEKPETAEETVANAMDILTNEKRLEAVIRYANDEKLGVSNTEISDVAQDGKVVSLTVSADVKASADADKVYNQAFTAARRATSVAEKDVKEVTFGGVTNSYDKFQQKVASLKGQKMDSEYVQNLLSRGGEISVVTTNGVTFNVAFDYSLQ